MQTQFANAVTQKENGTRLGGSILRAGGLVAFPTETVYGLGANGLDGEAVRRIFAAKGRPGDNPLILHVAKKNDAKQLWTRIPDAARTLMDAFWPGPLTLIFNRASIVPDEVTAGLETVAVRMPDNKTALALIRAAGVPVAAPSANTSGKPSPTTAEHVRADLEGKIDLIIDGGPCRFGVESTVLSLVGEPTILRPGAVTKEMLEAVAGPVGLAPSILAPLKDGETAASAGASAAGISAAGASAVTSISASASVAYMLASAGAAASGAAPFALNRPERPAISTVPSTTTMPAAMDKVPRHARQRRRGWGAAWACC